MTPVFVSVSVSPREIVAPPESPVPVETIIDELARFAFVIPAVPERLEFVNPEIVLLPAAMVLLVSVSVVEEVINPELFVHWEIFAEPNLETVSPEITVDP